MGGLVETTFVDLSNLVLWFFGQKWLFADFVSFCRKIDNFLADSRHGNYVCFVEMSYGQDCSYISFSNRCEKLVFSH